MLDRELAVIASAIGMVASGDTSRIALTGLRFGSELLDSARRIADEAQVVVHPVYGTDDRCCDLIIERPAGTGDR